MTTPALTLTRDEIISRNIAAVDQHFHNENPEGIDLAVGVYTDDIVWEVPARPVEIKQITPADVRAMMTARGTPQWEAEHFEEMYEMFRRGESEFVSDDVERITGRPPRDVDAYLRETLGDLSDQAARS